MHSSADRWFIDETYTYVRVDGRWGYLYWAFDQVIDVLRVREGSAR